MISRMKGTVIFLERPSKLLMETIFRNLTRPDHWMMKRTSDSKILSLGLEPQFFTEQAIWLSIPTPRDFTDMMNGVMDDGGYPMDTRTSFMDCIGWPFVGVVSTSAADLYLAFHDVFNGDLRNYVVFQTWWSSEGPYFLDCGLVWTFLSYYCGPSET